MPLSAQSGRTGTTGFTLIEVLLVLVIIGVIIGFALIAGSSRSVDDRIEEEARRLVRVLQLAADESTIQGIELGFYAEDGGYRFLTLTDRSWQPYGGNSALRARQLPAPIAMAIQVDGFDADPAEDDEEQPTPHAFFLSSGETTPFSILIYVEEHPSRFRIEGDLLGRIVLTRVASPV